MKPLLFGIICYAAIITITSHLRNVSPNGLLKRNEIVPKCPTDLHCSKLKLPNLFRSPGLEAKVMGSGPRLPELES